jgi:hypothetical protein
MTAAAAVAVLVGLHVASWGAYKDAPFEGFRLASYLRSIVLAAIIAGLIASLAPQLAPGVVLLIGTVYAIERLATEGWKAILREQDQDRYTIPMRLGFRGRPVDDNLTRYVVGAAVALGALAALSSLEAVQHRLPSPPPLLVLLAVGSAGGWATAVGGAWKDAPIEGFSGWKFLRSPAVATAWAVPLSFLTDSWTALLLASGGYAVATIETYKTFFTAGRPPGKFAGKPVQAHLPALRRLLAYQHAALWMAVAGAFAVTLSRLRHSPIGVSARALPPELPNVLLAAVAIGSVSLGTLTLCLSRRDHTGDAVTDVTALQPGSHHSADRDV